MRRTTQWAVFTSMNRQQPAWQSLYEPSERAAGTDASPDPTVAGAAQPDSDSRSAPDTRRDRVDLM
jgi:hypothetical protein